jgi:hypothetical protein
MRDSDAPPGEARSPSHARSSDRPTAYAPTQAIARSSADISIDETIALSKETGLPGEGAKLAPARYELGEVLGAGGMGEVRALADA